MNPCTKAKLIGEPGGHRENAKLTTEGTIQGRTQKFVHLYINEKFLVNQLPPAPVTGSDFLGAALAMLFLSVSTQIPLAMVASF